MPVEYDHEHENEITLFAETNFRNQRRRFGIKTDDRRRHLYVIGKTGMGKTVLQENMVMSDIMAGHGVCYVDPHGDTAEKILDYIPANRINDVVYFNPADLEFPVGFNILESVTEDQKHLVSNGLMGVFKKIWPDVWSARMEYILQNCVMALLDYPGATLLGINRLLVDDDYRKRVVAKIRDPIVKTFWVAEFETWTDKYKAEALPAIQNKVGQFLAASVIRNIVAQVKSTIDIRSIMDDGKIFIVNLSKGRIGEDNMRLLGGMIISRMQMAAMERVNIPEDDRRDFYLFVDEFQNFANESFASILSEARKYRLSLTVAHQYIEQLSDEVKAAVIGNVGTLLAFRVGSTDAEFLEREFTPQFTADDLVNLNKYNIYLKLMVDGVATSPFSATTLPPMAKFTGNAEKVIQVSRERYSIPRATINEKVLRWSGMETGTLRATDPESTEIDPDDLPNIKVADLKTASESEEAPKERPETKEFLRVSNVKSEEDEEADQQEEYLRISPERLESLQKMANAGQGKKKDKPKFSHTCSRCGKVWDMPVQLDPSRPMYCSDCLPIIREEQKDKGRIKKIGPEPESREPYKSNLDKDRPPKRTRPAKEPNKPRIIGKINLPPISELPPVEDDPDEPPFMGGGLIGELSRQKGTNIETRKRQVEKQMEGRDAAKPKITPPAVNQEKTHTKPFYNPEKNKAPQKPVIDDDDEPVANNRPESLVVFKKKPSPTEQDKSSSSYPSITGNNFNPLDKRQSHGIRKDASGQQPRSSNGPTTLNPGSRVTFD
ncbi:MAG: type IV secretion system DNA-binding domain-containing protein [Patescibacteria group bacterium]|nr:type IV secretion system DNA-binding domain-containing protein [Patescibacteria group bacterium]